MTLRARIARRSTALALAATADVDSCRHQRDAALLDGDPLTAAIFARGIVLAEDRAKYWGEQARPAGERDTQPAPAMGAT